MADKKPLVLGADGVIEELQSGDSLNATVSGEIKDLIDFVSGVAGLAVGDAVYVDSAGKLQKAKADAASTMPCRGFAVQAAAAVDDPTKLQTQGLLGGFSGLTPGAKQYVSPTTGGVLVEAVTTTAGQYIQEVGVAKSTTEIVIDIKQPIKRG